MCKHTTRLIFLMSAAYFSHLCFIFIIFTQVVSDEENQTMQIDETIDDEIHSINASFPKIDNLEYFPLKVLQQIFTSIDDNGLLNLAVNSYRFDGITKTIFEQRYASKYFVIDGESEEEQESYLALFSRFGSYIKAIKAIRIQNIDANHWMAQMLQKHTKQLEKLTMDACTFNNACEFLSEHMNITHLSLCHNNKSEIILPKYQNLKKLKMNKLRFISYDTIRRTILNNPTMESLHLRCSGTFIFHEVMSVVVEHLKHLKELFLIDAYLFPEYEMTLWRNIIDKFDGSWSHIESLGLTVSKHYAELLESLGVKCKNLQYLELKVPIEDELGGTLIDAIGLFENVESFSLEQDNYNDEIDAVLMRLPKLRHFSIKLGKSYTYTFILKWFTKYPTIETITIAVDYVRYDDPAFLTNVQFFYKFREIIQNRNVRIEFQEDLQTIGFMTKDEIIWRNKLKYWIGWDPSYNLTNLKLFDLAKQQQQPAMAEGDKQQSNLLNLILNHLDLGSIYALAETGKQGRQLVGHYMQQHSKQQASFTITNEYNSDIHHHIHGAQLFAKFVNNLNVYNLDWNRTYALQNLIRNSYKNVHKLCICKTDDNHPNAWIFPQIRHFVCDSLGFDGYSALYDISSSCRHLEILECKEKVHFRDCYSNYTPLRFRNLKKFIFKFMNDKQIEIIQGIFQNTNVELIPIKI